MTTSFDVLRRYLEGRASFTDRELCVVEAAFVPAALRAGEFLQRAGEIARHAAFVTRGCLRSFVVDSNGKEHIVQFAPENWWLADIDSLTARTSSRFFIDAIEDSDVLLIDPPSHERLVDGIPGYAASFRTGLQKQAAAKDQRIVTTLTTSAEERYLAFLEAYPSIASRVPQRMLASYLGVSPETISRVRAKLSRKQRSSRR